MIKSHVPPKIAIVALAVGAGVAGDAMLYAVLPANVSSFGLQVGLVGVILSINRYIRLFSNPWAARVYNRFGIYRPFTAALMVATVTTLSYGLVNGFWPLLVARIAWGICFSFLRLGGYLAALEEGNEEIKGRLMGFFNTGFRFGQLVGAFGGAILADLMGHPMAFSLVALLTGLGLLMVLAGGRGKTRWDTLLRTPHLEPFFLGLIGSSIKSTLWNLLITSASDLARPLRYRLLSVNYLRFGIGFAVEGLLVGTLALIAKEILGDRAQAGLLTIGITTVAGALLGIYWTSELALGPLLGHISDRVGRGRMVLASLPVIIVSLVIVGGVGAYQDTPLPLPMSNFLFIVIALPFLFVASTAISITLDAFAGDLAPLDRVPQVMSRYATWRDLGAATGPLLGYAVGFLIGLFWIYLAASLIICAGGILYLYSLKGAVRRT